MRHPIWNTGHTWHRLDDNIVRYNYNLLICTGLLHSRESNEVEKN